MNLLQTFFIVSNDANKEEKGRKKDTLVKGVKNIKTTLQLLSFHILTRVTLKAIIIQANSCVNQELSEVPTGFENPEKPDQITNILGP